MNYTKKIVLSSLLLQLGLLSVVAVWSSTLAVIVGVVLILTTVFFVERILTVLILYVSVLPTVAWASSIPFIPFVVRNEIVFLLVLLAFFYMFIQKMLEGRLNLSLTAMDKAFIIFLFIVGFAWLRGYYSGYPRGFLRGEFFYLASYSVYFVVVNTKMDERWTNRFWLIVVIGSLLAAIEYIATIIYYPVLIKVSTRLAHSAQISLPFLLMVFLSSKEWRKKSLYIAGILLILIMVLVSLQRGIWIGVAVSWLIILSWFFVKSGVLRIRPYFGKVLLLVLIGGIVISIFIGRVLDYRAESLFERVRTLSALTEDPSLFIRLDECFQAISKVKNIWIGNGLGDFIFQRVRGVRANFVDNSYFFFLWKMGVVGLAAYLAIIVVFVRRCIFVYRKSQDERLRYLAVVAISSFIGLQFLAQATACVAVYEFNPVWAILIGSVESVARRLERG